MLPLPPSSTLFPYTTLFRSQLSVLALANREHLVARQTLRAPEAAEDGGLEAYQSVGLGPHPEVAFAIFARSEEHTSELQSHSDLVCRLLLEKKKKQIRKK